MFNNLEFVKILKNIATDYKTVYVLGCFGSPLNDANKERYSKNNSYNKKSARTKKIKAASADTFGFDCSNLIKGVLWGWNGDESKSYGGAKYGSNNVPDINADTMISKCSNVSTDFSNIEVGEAVWIKGHIGIYIGDGLAVECIAKWADGVQITAVSNIGKKSGYNSRKWTKHGKLPYIEYIAEQVKPQEEKPSVTVLEWQKAAIADGFKLASGADGKWGKECEAVAKQAICKRRTTYKYKNLTKLVQKAVGVKVEGKFGKDTEAAVIKWQKLMGLTADGCVGLNSWKRILGV